MKFKYHSFENEKDTGICVSPFSFCAFTLKLSGLLLLLFFFPGGSYAQDAKKEKELPPPSNVKVLNEYKDAKGNTIRSIQYLQNGSRVTETVIIPSEAAYIRVPLNIDTLKKDSVSLVVDKRHYKLFVYYRKKIIRSYKAVFGPKPFENKRMEGDRCTPEGTFYISSKNASNRYDKFLLLSYPDDSDLARFNRLKASGHIPQNARIGGGVGIHGIWKGGDEMIEMSIGWTDGCIALKNKDIEELYSMVMVGTKVVIKL